MKTDPRTEVISAIGTLTYTLPALFGGWRVTAVEGGTVTRGGVALAVGSVLAAADTLTLTPAAPGGTTTLTVQLDGQEFSGDYGDLDGAPAALTAVTTDATLAGNGTAANPLKVVGGGGGSTSILGHGGPVGTRPDPSVLTATLPAAALNLELTWRGVSVLVGGFRLRGATLTAADFDYIGLVTGGDNARFQAAAADLTIRPYTLRDRWGAQVEAGTEVLVPTAWQVEAEYARLVIAFQPTAGPKIPATAPAAAIDPQQVRPGTVYELYNGMDLVRQVFGISVVGRGDALRGVLSPFNLPLVAAPTPLTETGDAYEQQGGLEVVWPLNGTPYLHVFRPRHADRAGVEYHLRLTAGLPQ